MSPRSRGAEPSAPGRASSPSPTTAGGSEEERAFFQARLALFGLAVFVLAGGAWVALALVDLLVGFGGRVEDYSPFSLVGSFHLASSILAGLLWLYTRRGKRSVPALHALDVGVTLALITTLIASGAILPDPMVAVFVALLSFYTAMLTRAIVVPSTARRTLLIGVAAGAAMVGFASWRIPAGLPVAPSLVPTACWTATAVVIGTLASHTIFGLRRQVDQARILGQYRLESKIGEGGMGEVWRASHALLRRPTAVKLLPPDRMGDEAIRRFEREVQITARLTHPNTVAIYDYGRTRDGIFYYAMELIEGIDLESLVARHGPQSPARVVHVLLQICGALAEAHDLGLVHRDIKPANVLISPRKGEHEFAKILDFGLVKSIDTGETGGGHPGITATNAITGTPLYMAPEAIRAPASVDARSDLYSLGALTWFLLVGRPPFGGGNILDVCSQHLHTAPGRPSSALGRAIPTDLEDAVLACLEKRPEDRPRDARALRGRLETSSAAGQWTARDAAAWWRDHQAAGPRSPADAERAHTIALDLTTRATLAPPAA
jgi:eukaryotic-like serine/threonine-protein kinase